MTIHDFDMARFMLGEEPDAVMATASVLVDDAIGEAGDFDSATITLTTPSGRHCQISNSRRATYGYDQRIEVLGSKGMVAAENHREFDIEIANENGFTRPALLDFFMSRYTDAYANEIAAFVAAVKSGQPASPSGNDGLIALQLADAAVKSVAEKRTVLLSEIS
jgi:myo-inositol 2-dehydrogenase/D-chiro-inositol 1-dehydrogenase